jgi:high-affinity nickel-transport protein
MAPSRILRSHRHASSTATAVATLHLAATGLFVVAMTSQGRHTVTLAVAMTAYLLGVRHAFDPDHIVAIDNTTRYLRARDLPARSVGFWFSLGHSSVVFLACVLLGVGWHSFANHLSGSDTWGSTAAGIWGPAFSGTFLVALAAVNGRILTDLWRHRHDPASHGPASRGFFTSLLGKRLAIRRPRQLLLVGFLFGLGFDTATSVGLLVMAAGGAQATLPWVTFVALPLVFAAGMTLFDSLDGAVMNRAYGWADSDVRKVRYNLTVTAISVVAALAVGGLTLIGLLGELLPT